MASNVSRRTNKKSNSIKKGDATSNQPKTKKKSHPGKAKYLVICLALIAVAVCFIYFYRSSESKPLMKSDSPKQKGKRSSKSTTSTDKTRSPTKDDAKEIPPELKDFNASIQKEFKITPIKIEGQTLKFQELKSNLSSSVRAYVIENFLSDFECDNLMRVHKKYLEIFSKNDPILCFDSLPTLKKNLKELKLKYKVSNKDFIVGTTCLNESFSSQLKPHFKWSYSTAFYPGENKFSTAYAERIQDATGLKQQNGGKFQITSYPIGVGYKSHTDCIVYEKGKGELRDRYATVLVYLQDVEEGGETEFPLLGIKVKPKKGLALVWNSMDQDGNCEPLSLHDAKKVKKGHKYIIQRWYYYKSFLTLGKRPPEPSLPKRKREQPRVSCDEYEQGSCRWYDEWNYDHIKEYAANVRNMA
ncbi:probable prolyl 4-hydroxylase 7 [Actinia tenebrosa]|uniref:Probable prolyl 4-hydroxylase 7 n=1 Tax=Actinia tenebrosa TaxID=6105 RepID=A0A6P8HV58_ACTTE|nr:probable prolyl 4-hydroxylase 7 [Actinia tenebrosa]